MRAGDAVTLFSGLLAGMAMFAPHAYALCTLPSTTGVSVGISSQLQQTVASAGVGYVVAITNDGPTSYDDASLAVEVRDIASSRIVDRFVQSNVLIAAHNSASPTFIWKTSGALVPGEYVVNAVFVPHDVSYGDAFSDTRLPRASARMQVAAGAQVSALLHDDIVVSVPGTLSIPVENTANAPYRGLITWRVYDAHGDLSAPPLAEKSDEIEMLPHGNTTMHFDVPSTVGHSYYVESKLSLNNATQQYAGAWIVDDTVSASNTNCDGGFESRMLMQIGVLILMLVAATFGWGYIRKFRALPPHAEPPQTK